MQNAGTDKTNMNYKKVRKWFELFIAISGNVFNQQEHLYFIILISIY